MCRELVSHLDSYQQNNKYSIQNKSYKMKNVINGSAIMLFYNQKSLALATNHTLSISADQIDISNKDCGSFASSMPGKVSWEMTTENMYVVDDFNTLFNLMINKTPITIKYGEPVDYSVNGLADNDDYWTEPTGNYYEGKAVITSLQQNAPNGEIATYSATFTGYGKIEYVAASNVTSLNP